MLGFTATMPGWLSSSLLGNLLGLLGLVAGVLGVIYSVLSFNAAKRADASARRAEEAARAATNVALARSLLVELGACQALANELQASIEISELRSAQMRASDLIAKVSFVVERWRDGLAEDSRKELMRARAQLNVMQKVLAEGLPAGVKLGQFLNAMQKVVRVFNEQHGVAVRTSD